MSKYKDRVQQKKHQDKDKDAIFRTFDNLKIILLARGPNRNMKFMTLPELLGPLFFKNRFWALLAMRGWAKSF